jgi:hypothetical protein
MDVVYHNGKACVPGRQLVDSGIVTYSNYKKLVTRKRIQHVQYGGNGRMALVAVNSIPDRLRIPYEQEHGALVKSDSGHYFESRIEDDGAAFEFFGSPLTPSRGDKSLTPSGGSRHLPEENQKQYYAEACVLNACGALLAERKTNAQANNRRFIIADFWDKMAKDIWAIDHNKFPHKLPQNGRRLAAKFESYWGGDNKDNKDNRDNKRNYESLVHRNFLNRNAAKVKDDVNEAVLLELMSHGNNLDCEQLAEHYNLIAQAKGWAAITGGTAKVWLKKNRHRVMIGRTGKGTYENKIMMQAKRYAPTRPMIYWTMDGWDVELMYQQKPEKGATTYFHRPTVVLVLDPCCKYPIGYATGTHETPALITEALRNAVNHAAELFSPSEGVRYMVKQLQSDRYGSGSLTDMYRAVAEKYTPARAHNAKAKVIEPEWNRYNAQCQLLNNWSGYGIASRKENQPNGEWKNSVAVKKAFPDFSGVCAQVDEIISMRRAQLIDEYMRLWNATPHDDLMALTDETYLYYLGNVNGEWTDKGKKWVQEGAGKNMRWVEQKQKEWKAYTNTLRGNGLLVTIGSMVHTYECFDKRMREYMYEKWTVKYDPADTSRVLAINGDGTLRFMMREAYVQPMALADRKAGDAEELQRIRNFNRELLEDYESDHQRRADIIHANVEPTLSKLLMTDSEGQHKRYLKQPVIRDSPLTPTGGIEDKAGEIEEEFDMMDVRTMY